jgi:hypothetical protein
MADLTNVPLEQGGSPPIEAAASFRPKEGWFHPITRREVAWLVVGSLAFALVFSYPILGVREPLGPGVSGWITAGPVFSHLTRIPANSDWDMFIDQWWVAGREISQFNQFPFWNPYECGGAPFLGNFVAVVATPFILLHLAFGLIAGLYLQIILHLALGFAGGYVLARVMGLGKIAGLVLSSVFFSTSWLYLLFSMGDLPLALPVVYWPWMLALYYVGIDRRKIAPLAVGGIMLALAATEGNYTFVYALILLGVLSPVIALTQRSVWPLTAAIVLVAFGSSIAAVRLLPSAEFLALYPRGGYAGPQDDILSHIPTFLFSRNQDLYRDIPGLIVYACYGAYISPAFALLAVVGLLTGRLKILPWLVAAIVFLSLARGNTGPHSAWGLLHRLPLCGNLAFPTRFMGPFVFMIGAIAAYGADFVCRNAGRWGYRTAGALLIVGLADAWLVGPPNLRYMYRDPVLTMQYNTQFRQFWSDNTQVMTEYNQANLGAVNCYSHGIGADEPTSVVGYNQPNYSGEYYLVGPGHVSQIEWTPNQLRYHVSVTAPTQLVVNQNYYPGWRLERGVGDITSRNGLLAVRIPAGSQDITLRFLPTHLGVTLTLTLLGLIATIVVWKRGY